MAFLQLSPWRKQALEDVADQSTKGLAITAAVVYGLLAIAHFYVLDSGIGRVMGAVAALTSVLCALIVMMSHKRIIFGSAPVGIIMILAILNSTLHMMLTRQDFQTTNFLILLLVTAFFLLQPTYALVLQLINVGSWIAAMSVAGGNWIHYGFAMALALAITNVIGRVRRRNILGMTSRARSLRRSEAELQDGYKLLQQQEAELRGITESTTDLMLRLSGGTITYANRTASNLLAGGKFSLIGTQFKSLVAPVSHPECDKLLATTNQTDKQELRLIGSNGIRIWHDCFATPLAQGELLLVCHDVEERRKVEKLKDSVIATTGHELRTPLTSIQGALQLMEGADEATVESLRTMAVASSERLVRLVNQSLDLEKITRLEGLNLKEHGTMELIQAAVEGVATHPKRQGKEVETTGEDITLQLDKDKIVQVLTNLLGNALRYAPDGSTIRVGCRPVSHAMEFFVRDEGPGVPTDARERIFAAFEQVEDAETRHDGTSGLGLTISKAIVEAHGGSIWLADTPTGAEFRFKVPHVAPDE